MTVYENNVASVYAVFSRYSGMLHELNVKEQPGKVIQHKFMLI